LAAGLAAWAVIDEATQPLFGRAADPLDWVYDVIGLALGIGLVVAVNSLVLARGSR
jgi:VanZ family protein